MDRASGLSKGGQAPKRILVTGGCGFIGINLAAHYLQGGHEVIAYDNFSRPGAEENAEWLAPYGDGRLMFVVADVRDEDSLARAMERVDLVVHLAAQVAVTSSVEDPRQDFSVNALGGFNVLEAARLSGSDPVVLYASTNKVYGALEGLRLSETEWRYETPDYRTGFPETFPIDLHSPYGCSKGASDLYALDYARIYGLRTVVFRQSCIYGPRQFGIEDQGWVAHFVISALAGRPITIYGDGRQVRDVLHVRDLIAAFELAVENIGACAGKAYNIGGGPDHSLSLLELIERLRFSLDRQVQVRFADWRPGDQRVYISDIRRAERDFRWTPQIGINQGLEELCGWVSENPDLFEGAQAPECVGPSQIPVRELAGRTEAQAVPVVHNGEGVVDDAQGVRSDSVVLSGRLQAAENEARRRKLATRKIKETVQ